MCIKQTGWFVFSVREGFQIEKGRKECIVHAADVMAQSMINGTERLFVAITNPSLTVDDLQRALGQAFPADRGGTCQTGWIRLGFVFLRIITPMTPGRKANANARLFCYSLLRHSLPVFRFVYIFASAPPAGTMSAQGAADASGTALLLFAQAEHCCPYDNHENSCHNQTFHCCSFPVSILHIISLQASLSIHFLS